MIFNISLLAILTNLVKSILINQDTGNLHANFKSLFEYIQQHKSPLLSHDSIGKFLNKPNQSLTKKALISSDYTNLINSYDLDVDDLFLSIPKEIYHKQNPDEENLHEDNHLFEIVFDLCRTIYDLENKSSDTSGRKLSHIEKECRNRLKKINQNTSKQLRRTSDTVQKLEIKKHEFKQIQETIEKSRILYSNVYIEQENCRELLTHVQHDRIPDGLPDINGLHSSEHAVLKHLFILKKLHMIGSCPGQIKKNITNFNSDNVKNFKFETQKKF